MTRHESKRHGKSAGIALAAILLASAGVLWSWNTVAADLFGLPVMEFRHGVAFVVAGLSIGVIAVLTLAFAGAMAAASRSTPTAHNIPAE